MLFELYVVGTTFFPFTPTVQLDPGSTFFHKKAQMHIVEPALGVLSLTPGMSNFEQVVCWWYSIFTYCPQSGFALKWNARCLATLNATIAVAPAVFRFRFWQWRFSFTEFRINRLNSFNNKNKSWSVQAGRIVGNRVLWRASSRWTRGTHCGWAATIPRLLSTVVPSYSV